MIVQYHDKTVSLNDNETVLDALLGAGFDMSYGCKAGACQSCLLQAENPESVPPQAQVGLSEAQKQLGYFLACSCIPNSDLVISDSNAEPNKVSAEVVAITPLNRSVVQLKLKANLHYSAGQYINLWKDEHLCRSYSIASIPNADNIIELQIKLIPNGIFSQWINEVLSIGDNVDLSPPLGECFYTPATERPLLLAGMGTGLAPLYGIAQDALRNKHTAPIHLISAARSAEDLYLWEPLQQLEKQHANFKVSFLAMDNSADKANVIQADVYAWLKEQYPSTKTIKAYLCGAESFVRKLKKQLFLAGANMKDIQADVFLPAKN